MGRLDNVDLRLLHIFVAIVEGRGFAAAQAQLNVGASTISNHMTALETRLGVTLCSRGRTGFKLTPDGELIYAAAQRLFSAAEEFEFKAGTLKSSKRSSMALGIIDNTISDPRSALHSIIGNFVGKNRDIRLLLECRPPNELLREINERRLDVAIGSFPKISLGLNYIKLYDEEHCFYCGDTHPLFPLANEDISMASISQYPVISRGYWASHDVRHIRPEKTLATVNSMEAGARLVLSGAYLGYLPEHYAKQWVNTGQMRAINRTSLGYPAPFEIVYANAAMERPIIKRFIQDVVKGFS